MLWFGGMCHIGTVLQSLGSQMQPTGRQGDVSRDTPTHHSSLRATRRDTLQKLFLRAVRRPSRMPCGRLTKNDSGHLEHCEEETVQMEPLWLAAGWGHLRPHPGRKRPGNNGDIRRISPIGRQAWPVRPTHAILRSPLRSAHAHIVLQNDVPASRQSFPGAGSFSLAATGPPRDELGA